uniref:Secreted protein n=1 Tax=Rhizophora mucronata TaxID=61149 RepID=A0A2P2P4X3_RHIMU
MVLLSSFLSFCLFLQLFSGQCMLRIWCKWSAPFLGILNEHVICKNIRSNQCFWHNILYITTDMVVIITAA